MSPPPEKVGGHVPRVPHQIAPMGEHKAALSISTVKHSNWLKKISMFNNLRINVINFAAINCCVNRLATVISPIFFSNRRHLFTVLLMLQVKFIEHVITDYQMFCLRNNNLLWQYSTVHNVKSCFKAVLLIIPHEVGWIFDSSRLKIIRLKLFTTFH